MPILVVCPGCSAKLNTPDNAAGKKVRCPRPGCGSLILVPAAIEESVFESEKNEPAAKPVKKLNDDEPLAGKTPRVESEEDDDRPRKKVRPVEEEGDRPRKQKPRSRDDDDQPRRKKSQSHDDEDDDNQPRRKKSRSHDDEEADGDDWPRRKRKKQSGGMPPIAIVGIIFGALVILGGCGYGIYYFAFNKPDSTSGGRSDQGSGGPSSGGGRATAPAGWKEYAYAEDKFKAFFPEQPEVDKSPNNRGEMPKSVDSASSYYVQTKYNKSMRTFAVTVLRFRTGTTSAEKDQVFSEILKDLTAKSRASEPKAVSWAGLNAREVTLEDKGAGRKGGGIVRYAVSDNLAYLVMLGSDTGRLKPEDENGFLENFTWLK